MLYGPINFLPCLVYAQKRNSFCFTLSGREYALCVPLYINLVCPHHGDSRPNDFFQSFRATGPCQYILRLREIIALMHLLKFQSVLVLSLSEFPKAPFWGQFCFHFNALKGVREDF